MSRRWKSSVLLPLVLVVLGSCEARAPSAPETAAPGGARGALLADGSYTLVQGSVSLAVLSTSRWIGIEGGMVKLGDHALTVPAGAVLEPTLFSITQPAGSGIEVELLALQLDPLLGYVDVGVHGFEGPTPVRLTLSYSDASNVSDPSRLRVLHLQDDGGVETLPSTVDRARRTVTAALEHFSRYCMAID